MRVSWYYTVRYTMMSYLIPAHKGLTHWGRVTHICVGNLTIIGSDNGLSPGRRQAITWTNVGILLIRPLGTNFSEMLIEIHTFSFKKIHLKMASGKWRPFCLGLIELILSNNPEWVSAMRTLIRSISVSLKHAKHPDIKSPEYHNIIPC